MNAARDLLRLTSSRNSHLRCRFGLVASRTKAPSSNCFKRAASLCAPLRYPSPCSGPSGVLYPWAAITPTNPRIRTSNSRYMSLIPPEPPSWPSFLKLLRWRIKVMLMRTQRPWTIDDVLALASWLFVGKSMFLLIATTSSVSLVLWIANSLNFDEIVASAVGSYLTKSTGATVFFESAIVPKWKQGRISLRNVSVKRLHALDESKLAPGLYSQDSPQEQGFFWQPQDGQIPEDEKCNFTRYDLHIDNIDITLDLLRWLEGKGLVRDAVVRGVRGVVDRTGLRADCPITPLRIYTNGDFDLEAISLEDLFVTVYNPMFRSYPLSVLNLELPRLRKQWLLYDIMSATSLVGMLDNCLFSLHAPQQENDKGKFPDSPDGKAQSRFHMRQLKLDGLPIDHLNYGTVGPFSWMKSGFVDIFATIRIPAVRNPADAQTMMRGIVSDIKKTPAAAALGAALDSPAHISATKEASKATPISVVSPANKMQVAMKIDVRFRNIKVKPPTLASQQVPYLTQAWVRPLAGYMNSRRIAIPINFTLELPIANFDGAWTIYQAGLAGELASAIGQTLTANMLNEAERARRIRVVGLWSIQTVTRSVSEWWQLFSGYASLADFFRFFYSIDQPFLSA